jgi:protein involved in polysaccharide export with SLBB domain
VELEPFDWVTILRQPEFELLRTVKITGEVRFPGPYALTHKEERVSSLISRAGGLLPTAYADGGRFFRSLDNAGRVNMDLANALRTPGGRDDITLQPGDSLHVPEYVPTVLVQGAVHSTTSVLYEDGANLDYYIGNAGGFTRFADEGRVSVRYANGSAKVKKGGFLFFGSTPKPGPGSTVFVPTKDLTKEGFDVTSFVSNLVGIAASVATVILVIDRTR